MPSLSLLSILALPFFSLALSLPPRSRCLSTTLSTHPLPPTPLSLLNPDLPHSPNSTSTPSFGSGLAQLSPTTFLALTDRGPVSSCPTRPSSKAFLHPSFAPSIAVLSLNPITGALTLTTPTPLHGRTPGKPRRLATGLPNSPRDDTPLPAECRGKPLPYDAAGLDPEDLALIPGTPYLALVEEYNPSLLLVHSRTGRILARHAPRVAALRLRKDKALGYPVFGDIPNVYANRRKNRGFEAVVVDASAKYVIAIVQSPMLDASIPAKTENNPIIRCAYFSLSKSRKGPPRLRYRHSFIIEASPPDAYVDPSNAPTDIKYSAAQYAAPGKFVVLERAKGQVKLFLIDWTRATNIDNTRFGKSLALERATNNGNRPAQLGVMPAEKTLIWDSAPGVGGSVNWYGSEKQEGFAIDKDDPSRVWMVDDNDFGLDGAGPMQLRKIALGRSVTGATVCDPPEHPPSPSINVKPSKTLRLRNPQTFRVMDKPDIGSAENLDVDEEMKRVYVVNLETNGIDRYDVSTDGPPKPRKKYVPDAPYEATSVAVCKENGFIAVGLANDDDEGASGAVHVLKKNFSVDRKINVDGCVLVDDVQWTQDCKYLIAACEGEGKEVPGGVLIADFGGPKSKRFRGATVADFSAFDTLVSTMKKNGVRLVESNIPSMDLEPEYITIIGKHAFVTLQEANAIAVVDIFEAKVTELKPIGFINRSKPGFGIDASDKDGKVNIRKYPFLFGMPQPDSISKYEAADGETYLVFLNEGDAKDSEEARGGDITDPDALNRTAVPGLKRFVENKNLLGRLKFSTIMGYNNVTNTQEEMYHFGSRSFSIMKLDGTVVFDSGEWFARIQEKHFKPIFNSNVFDEDDLSGSQADLFDKRSDDKGAEPESLSIMAKDGKTYAFMGLERPSIIVVFDITVPKSPIFVEAVQNNPFKEPTERLFAEGRQGDLDPEGLFASEKLGKVFVSGSVSSTVTSYDIEL